MNDGTRADNAGAQVEADGHGTTTAAPGGWLAGRYTPTELSAAELGDELAPISWELLGIYQAEADAVARCRTLLDFVWSAPFGADERLEMPGCYFPLTREG